jgi:hypothetical protein
MSRAVLTALTLSGKYPRKYFIEIYMAEESIL